MARSEGAGSPAGGITFSARLDRNPVPDVVLLDIDLDHELSGRDILQRVRQAWPAVTVLMCSHRDEVEEVAECLRQGADDFIGPGK